jgi:hypothetical protein
MILRQLFDSTSSTYSYLIASRHGAEALIIDPVLEKVDRYVQLLKELDLRLVKAIDTAQMGKEEAHHAPPGSQPLTRGECDKAGLKWNDQSNVCG